MKQQISLERSVHKLHDRCESPHGLTSRTGRWGRQVEAKGDVNLGVELYAARHADSLRRPRWVSSPVILCTQVVS
jgi:hypothetical protein